MQPKLSPDDMERITKALIEQPKVGDRVGAIQSSDGNDVKFFGYGVYEGDFPICTEEEMKANQRSIYEFYKAKLDIEFPEETLQAFAKQICDDMLRNPRIKLDSGETVWGCQCWWGAEEKMKKEIEGKNIIIVPVEELPGRELKIQSASEIV